MTFLKFIPGAQINPYRTTAYTVSNVALNGYLMVTSTSVGNNLPYRATDLEFRVCALNKYTQTFPNECFYRFERSTYQSCSKDPNSGEIYDTRYVSTGLAVSEY